MKCNAIEQNKIDSARSSISRDSENRIDKIIKQQRPKTSKGRGNAYARYENEEINQDESFKQDSSQVGGITSITIFMKEN